MLYEEALGLIQLSQYERAVEILEDLFDREKENLWVNYELIRLYVQQGQLDEAMDLINRSLAVYPDQGILMSQKINVLVLLQAFNAALDLALNELDKDEDNQVVRYQLVGIYEGLKDDIKAREIEADYMLNRGSLIRARYLYQLVLKSTKDLRVKYSVQEKIEKIDRLEEANK